MVVSVFFFFLFPSSQRSSFFWELLGITMHGCCWRRGGYFINDGERSANVGTFFISADACHKMMLLPPLRAKGGFQSPWDGLHTLLSARGVSLETGWLYDLDNGRSCVIWRMNCGQRPFVNCFFERTLSRMNFFRASLFKNGSWVELVQWIGCQIVKKVWSSSNIFALFYANFVKEKM